MAGDWLKIWSESRDCSLNIRYASLNAEAVYQAYTQFRIRIWIQAKLLANE